MNPSYIGYFGSFGAGRVRRFLGVRLWLLVLVVAIFGVCGVVGGERVYAASDEDICYSIEWGDSTTNRVCSTVGLVDAGKLYAEETDDVVRLGVKDNNVCLARYNDTTKNLDILECVEIGGNNGSTINDALKKILKDYEDLFPSGSVRSAKRRAKAWELTASELVLEERELQEARGDRNTDSCVALEYTYNGKTRYTNKLCVNSDGLLESDTAGASDTNPTFVARRAEWAAMNIKGNTEIGKTDWNGVMALSEFAGVVWANACKNGSACNGYELTGNILTADRDSEEWSKVDQTTTEDPENKSAVCYKGSGALGWIMCPIIEGASGIGNYMWNQIEENHLKIPASEIFADNGGVYNGWEVVRNIANIAFVILFMVVIFSQLTGRGIDNYGIKKILPRLIVVAILMNMSYLICELAVDLSNIVGNGLNNLLSGLADGSGGLSDADTALSQANALEESSDFSQVTGWAAVAGLASGGTALFLLLNPGTAFLGAASIGLAVLGLVITIVVAMLTLYLILVIREAGIVILIVLAPVAMVCYTLPNMDKWFKKWLDLGKALLIVYPLCGLAVGGGQLAGAILGTIPNQSMKIAAMIVQVLPFFLIPTLLRRSLSLMGNIGARVSNIGRGLGRRGSNRAQNAVRNSNRFKDFSQYQQERAGVQRAQRIKRRLSGRTNLSERERDRLSKANAALLSYEDKKKRAEIGSDEELGYNVALEHQQAAFANEREKSYSEIFSRNDRKVNEAEFKNALEGDDAEKASAAMATLVEQGGIEEALRALEGTNWKNMNAGVRTRLLQKMGSSNIDAMKSFAKYRQSGGAADFKEWASGTGSVIASEAGNTNIKDKTFAQHLRENGVHAVDGYSKDEMKFVQKNKDGIRAGLGDGFYGAMLSSTAVNSKDAKAKTIAEGTITQDISEGKIDIDHLGLTPEMIGAMRDDTALAIKNGYVELWKRRVPGISDADAERDATNYIRSNLAGQIGAINTDDRIRNRTSQGVKDVFNIH